MKAILVENFERSKNHKLLFIAAIVVCTLLFAILQDLLSSIKYNREFYFEESFLFSTFWFWFIPLSVLYKSLLESKYLEKKSTITVAVLISIILMILVHALCYAAGVFLLSSLFYESTYGILKALNYSIIHDFYNYIFGYSALSFLFLAERKHAIKKIENPIEKEYYEAITIESGAKNLVLPVKEIILIAAESPYVLIHTKDRSYLHSETLKALSLKLDPSTFLRVHKSAIINSKYVTSYKSRLNGDYDITLSNNKTVRLSRTFAPEFKKLFN